MKHSILTAMFGASYAMPEEAASAGDVPLSPPVPVSVPSNYVGSEISFNFKTNKKFGIRRPTVKLIVPQATPTLLSDIISKGGKQLDLLMEAVNGILLEQARVQVGDNEKIDQDSFDLSKINWEAISNLPPAARRGGGIPKEVWEDFLQDYLEVMPAATGKTIEQVTNAAKLFVLKLQPVKTNKLFLNKLDEQLNIWFEKTPNAEDFADNYEFLSSKIAELLKKDDAELLANI